MDFSSDTTMTEYEISLSSCRDIIEEIFDIKYKEYHNFGRAYEMLCDRLEWLPNTRMHLINLKYKI